MLKIIPFEEKYKSHFYKINEEWISQMFQMEPIDELVLSQPEQMILESGGFIWFAEHHVLGIIGTVALRKTSQSEYELTKMGVYNKARGLKAGELLLKHVIGFVKEQNIENCYLLTNSACESAIHLYLKNGFVHDKDIKDRHGSEYKRADVAMKLVY